MLISDVSCDNKTNSFQPCFLGDGRTRSALDAFQEWAHSKMGWSGLIAGKTDDGWRSCSGSVCCAEEGDRKGSLIYSVCCIHGEPLGFGRIPKEVASTKTVEYRTVSGRVVYYGRMLYLVTTGQRR